MRWVEDTEVMEASSTGTPETCNFCGKVFESHHAFTAHLRSHGADLNNLVFNIVSSATKPMTVDDIQALSGMSVNVRNSVYRLVEQGRIRRVKPGKFAIPRNSVSKPTPIGPRAIKQNSVSAAVSLENSMPETDWDSLLASQLKKHPELYQRISNEVVAAIKQYLAHKA